MSKDTIYRQAAIDVIDAVFPVDPLKSEYAQGIACGAALAKTYVEQLPSAQPERKRGEWELQEDLFLWEGIFDGYFCSECGKGFLNDLCCNNGTDWVDVKKDFKFCPFCGADMRGEI